MTHAPRPYSATEPEPGLSDEEILDLVRDYGVSGEDAAIAYELGQPRQSYEKRQAAILESIRKALALRTRLGAKG